MTLTVALRLGRVSNLPTTWTNVLAGIILAGGTPSLATTPGLLLAISLFYVGGMYLNDGFDREIDARERPERPIPSGQVSARTVFIWGFGMLAMGEAMLVALALATPGGRAWPCAATGLALGAAIVFYDAHHKNNPLGPLVMGACRVLVYITAALAVGSAGQALGVGIALALSYLIGLTYVAKQENLARLTNLWPLLFLALPFSHVDALSRPAAAALYVALGLWLFYTLSFVVRSTHRNIPRAVAQFIAGISLLDAMLVATQGATLAAGFCVIAFACTLLFQRVIPGT